MDHDEMLARLMQQQTELGNQVIRLFASQAVRHELQLSTLVSLIAFLTPMHPCCLERVSSALLDTGLRFAELARKQESAQPQIH